MAYDDITIRRIGREVIVRWWNKLPAVLGLVMMMTGCASVSPVSINEQPGQAARLVLHFDGIDSEEGHLLVFVHDNRLSYSMDSDTREEGFAPFREQRVEPQIPQTTLVIDDIPEGNYVISAYQDEDDNGYLDRQIFPFIGMPTEPYGFSNNVYSYFSKADFDDAVIAVKAPQTEVSITVSSHLKKVFTP